MNQKDAKYEGKGKINMKSEKSKLCVLEKSNTIKSFLNILCFYNFVAKVKCLTDLNAVGLPNYNWLEKKSGEGIQQTMYLNHITETIYSFVFKECYMSDLSPWTILKLQDRFFPEYCGNFRLDHKETF